MNTQSQSTSTGQTWRERYGEIPMQSDATDDCSHDGAQLVYVGAALDEWFCFDCHKKVRVWNASP